MDKIQYNKRSIIKYFNSGAESNIYLYDDFNYQDFVLLKKFKSTNDIFLNNKENKIEFIGNNESFKDEIKIYDMVYEKKFFVGYTMEYSFLKKFNSFSKRKIKINQLKLLREKVEKLNNNNIFIGDFDEKNFLTSPEGDNIKLCDLDNYKIDKYDFDVVTRAIINFRKNCNKDEYIDSYCFNLFTIAYLYKINFAYLCEYINDFNFSYFHNKENKEILESMKHLDDSYQYKFLIDNIK